MKPGGAGGDREFDWAAPAVEDVDPPRLPPVAVDRRKLGGTWSSGRFARGRTSTRRPERRQPFPRQPKLSRLWQLNQVDAGHHIPWQLLPVRVADVRLIHHVWPLAAGERVVVVAR